MTSVDLTFINALESSPVHCVNPRPSLNRRRFENGGAQAILPYLVSSQTTL
jgi:hypothetical protein